MAGLPSPIDTEIACPAPRFRDDPEPGRPSRAAPQLLTDHNGTHDYYPYSWGYTVIRMPTPRPAAPTQTLQRR